MPKKPKFQTPKGMHDILPEDQVYYQRIYDVVSRAADFYGFGKIDTPILEKTELFLKGVGEATDITQKEMYTFKTKGGDYLSLRPEGTAPIVRAYIQNGMSNRPHPVKLWYFGPFFRHENPQAGRYRQFWQFGFEIISVKSEPIIDAQLIEIFYEILKDLNLNDLIVKVNSIGCSQCQPRYKKVLKSYFRGKENYLCRDCARRVNENILRIFDCKNEKCQKTKENAPQILDYLCEECRQHFKEVLEFLEELEIPYTLDPFLVRGLDYYTKTVFEFFVQEKDKDFALGGGGRYDKLIKKYGGKDTPASGMAGGVERIISLIKDQDFESAKKERLKVFLAQLGELAKRKSLKLLKDFRKANIFVSESFGRDSLKSQLSKANRIKAKYVIIIGQEEALNDSAIIRDMENGNQKIVKIENVVKELKLFLKNKNKK